MSKFEKKIGHYLKMNKSKEFFDNLINNENIKESIDNLFSKDNCSCKQIIEIYSSNSNNPSSTIINNNNNINSKNVKIIDRIKKFDINEKIVLDSLLKIKEEATLTCQEIIEYKNEDNLIKRLFYSIERIVHKNLHCKKELNKNCKVLNKEENNDFKEDNNSININNNYLEKIIEKKQKDNKEIEFIAIKTIIISMMNITTEMTCIYLQTLVKNTNNNNENSFDIKDFKIIHDEYVLVSNYCTTLENYFQKSFENFKNKYQINFTLSELFTDIFWNSLFHRKIFCESFINNYGNENISKSIQEDLNKIIKCLLLPILSLKHQISELLEIKELTEKNEKYDLISLINIEKNKYQEQINLNKIKEDKKNKNNNNLFKSLSFTNNNNNLNNSSSDEDIISNKDFENFEIKEDKKETTITRILEYNSTTVEKFHDKKIIEKKEIYRCENIIENNFNHIKKNKFIELLDEGNNKKENIFNTIDIINSSNDNVNTNNNEEEEFKIDSPEFKFIKAKEFTPNINELLQNKFNNKNNINKNNNKLNNNKSKKNKNNNDNLIKNFDNKTLDEIYNYIIDDNKNNNQNINKKKKNKKKKNKENNNDIFNISQNLNNNNNNYNNNNYDINYNNNNYNNDNDNNYNNDNNDNENNDLDPIVEKFKSELSKITINALDIQKIKPVISNQWIESIEKYY